MGTDIKKAILLTAGTGTRLQPHTNEIPKPCLPFLNLPLFYYGFYLAQSVGIKDYIFNHHYLSSKLKPEIEKLGSRTQSINFSNEDAKILGSGGALWQARKHLKPEEKFLVANGDEILIPTSENLFQQFLDQAQQTPDLCTLLLCDHPELGKTLNPVWVDAEGFVKGFGKSAPEEGLKPFHYTGYKVFSNQIFEYLPEGESNIFYEVLVDAIKKGEKVSSFYSNDLMWNETGNFQSYLFAFKECLKIFAESTYFKNLYSFYGLDSSSYEIIVNDQGFLFKPRDLNLPSDIQWRGLVSFAENSPLVNGLNLQNVICTDNSKLQANRSYSDCFIL